MHSVNDPEQTADDSVYDPAYLDEDDTDAWYDAPYEDEDTMPYPARSRRWQMLRLFLLLLLIVAAAAFVVFVLLPTLESWLASPPSPQLQPPVQV